MKNPPPTYPRQSTKLRNYSVEQLTPGTIRKPLTAPDKIRCRSCMVPFAIPWEKLKSDTEAVPSSHEVDGQTYLRPVSGLFFFCPFGHINFLNNQHPNASHAHAAMYGDESYFEHAHYTFYVYCLVGGGSDALAELTTALNSLKSSLRPDVDPQSWVHHVWEVRGIERRAELGISLSVSEINQLFRKFIADISEVFSELGVFVTLSGYDDREHERVRDHTISSSIHMAVENITEQGYECSFYLETSTSKEKLGLSDDHIERLARGLFCNPAFVWDTRGCVVELPITIPKEARAELELADFIAFWVKRHFQQKSQGKVSEVALDDFGPIRWAFNDPVRRMFDSRVSKGVPDFPIEAPSE